MSRTSLRVARLMWVVPGLLLLLSLNQAKVAYDLHRTLVDGTPAVAEVVEYDKTERADVTFAYVRLRVPVGDRGPVERMFPLPISLLPQVEGKEQVDVLVLPGAAQEVVIAAIARPQWRMAAINAAICLVLVVLGAVAVRAWNGYLVRKGDPAEQAV